MSSTLTSTLDTLLKELPVGVAMMALNPLAPDRNLWEECIEVLVQKSFLKIPPLV